MLYAFSGLIFALARLSTLTSKEWYMSSYNRTQNRIFIIELCIIFVISLGLINFVSAETLNDITLEALRQNPEIQAAEQRWHLYEQRIEPAASLDDPRLSFGLKKCGKLAKINF